MIEHLPALQVVVPLMAAASCLLIRRESWVRGFTVVVAWLTFGIAVMLLDAVRETGPIHYDFGGWPRPLGIEYSIDLANAFMLFIVSLMAAVVIPIGPHAGGHDIPKGREHLFYSAFLLCLTGLLGVTITGDVFNIFVFLEISSLATYILVAMGRKRRALSSAFNYLIIGTIGATFFLIGIGFMYQMTGTLNMADMVIRLADVSETRTVIVAFAFVMVGLSIKLAVFPLHQWLPNAYTYAPSVVGAFLASTATKVAYYVLVRFLFTIFGAAFVFDSLQLHLILLPLSVLAMFSGAIAAIFQANLKRMLAYSSISQIGYMTLGLSLHSVTGLTAGMVHLFNHALTKGGLFLVAAAVMSRIGTTKIPDMRGLGRRMPYTSAALVIAGLGLIGVPGTAGFVSKWYLVSAALENDRFDVTILILLSSMLAVIYVWRLIETIYFQEPPADAPAGEASLEILIPMYILVGGSIYFGFFTDFSLGVAAEAAVELWEVAS